MGPPSCKRSVVDQNVGMQRMTVLLNHVSKFNRLCFIFYANFTEKRKHNLRQRTGGSYFECCINCMLCNQFMSINEIWLDLKSQFLLGIILYMNFLHSTRLPTAYQLLHQTHCQSLILYQSNNRALFQTFPRSIYFSVPRQPTLHSSNFLSSRHHKTYPQFRQFSLQFRSEFLNVPIRQCLTTARLIP
jgi:hypothetical protein